MIGLDLFSGAGGMALGARYAGIDVRLAIEADEHAAKTYQSNHPDTEVFVENICKITKLPKYFRDEPVILFGGPPCQGFSTSNQKTRSLINPLNWLFRDFVRIAKEIKPEWIVFENVKGLKETCKGSFFESILASFETIGYTTSYWTLDASDCGVPQSRKRLFIIGSINGHCIAKPKQLGKKPVTVRDAISDLPSLSNGASRSVMPYKCKVKSSYATKMRGNLSVSPNHLVTRNSPLIIERYKHIPQGGNWQNIPHHLMESYKDYNRCHTGIYHRLRLDRPSIVVGNYRKNMLIHPTENRGLSVREAARLQSFPDWYEFYGSIGFQQQQVGNAVPPLMAYTAFKPIFDKF
jgi:DNA (cytosine-5)-methyltransferase 1